MKRLIMAGCMLLALNYCFCQKVNTGLILKDYHYLDVWLTKSGIMKKTVHCSIDVGLDDNVYLVDEKGSPMIFKNTIGVFNYLGKNGWEYVETYKEVEGGFKLDHYIFKQKN